MGRPNNFSISSFGRILKRFPEISILSLYDDHNLLVSDTIGRKDNPTENDIRNAIAYSDGEEGFCSEDIVRLQIDQDNYLVIWIGNKQTCHRLELIQKGNKAIECVSRFDSETAIHLLTSYLNGNIAWVKEYQWKKPIILEFLDNLERLRETRT